jgi:hypothetical protein
MIAHTLSRNNPSAHKVVDNLVNRTGNTESYLNSLFIKKLHGLHSHPSGKHMRDPACGEHAGEFSWFMTRVLEILAVKNFFIPDMVYRISFTMTKM